MTVDCDVHPAFFQCAHVHHGAAAPGKAVETVHGDGAAEAAGPCKGDACTQELFHDALPVAVGACAGPVETFENLMVDAYRQDAEIFPEFFSFSRGEGLQRPVGCGNRSGYAGNIVFDISGISTKVSHDNTWRSHFC